MIEFRHVSKYFEFWEDRPESIKRVLIELAQGKLSHGRRQRIEVLTDISFNIGVGEFVGIMGRNGAGKSTLLKLIAGIYSPNEGQVIRKGRIAPMLELGAGFVGDLSGYDNIFLNSAIMGYSRAETQAKVESILEFSELKDFIYMPVKKYSSGMLVRLGFAISIHTDAPILLFDEVLAVGDSAFQQKCLAKIEELHREGRTIILVSHDRGAIERTCSRTIVLANSHVEYDGPPGGGSLTYERVVSQPRDLAATS